MTTLYNCGELKSKSQYTACLLMTRGFSGLGHRGVAQAQIRQCWFTWLCILRCFSTHHGCKEQLFALPQPSCQVEPVQLSSFISRMSIQGTAYIYVYICIQYIHIYLTHIHIHTNTLSTVLKSDMLTNPLSVSSILPSEGETEQKEKQCTSVLLSDRSNTQLSFILQKLQDGCRLEEQLMLQPTPLSPTNFITKRFHVAG